MSETIFNASDETIESWISGGKLPSQLPQDWCMEFKRRQELVNSASQRNAALETRRFWLTFLGMVPICLFALDVWPAFGITVLNSIISLVIAVVVGFIAVALEDTEPTDDAYVLLENRIVAAVERLNRDDRILERALADGYIKQAWVNNLMERRRIESEIEAARRSINDLTYLHARNRRDGKHSSAISSANLSDSQTRLRIALAELTAAGSWTLPNLPNCRERYLIGRDGNQAKKFKTT